MLEMTFHVFFVVRWGVMFRGRGNIRGCWRATPVASLSVLEVSCVAANKHECRSSIVLCSP